MGVDLGDPASAQEVGIETPKIRHFPRLELCDPASAQEVGIETGVAATLITSKYTSVILPPLRRWELRPISRDLTAIPQSGIKEITWA